MAFKMKGWKAFDINTEGARPDGRAKSSAFQKNEDYSRKKKGETTWETLKRKKKKWQKWFKDGKPVDGFEGAREGGLSALAKTVLTASDPETLRAETRGKLRKAEAEKKAKQDKKNADLTAEYKKYHDEYDTVGIKDQRDGTTEWGGKETDAQYKRRMDDLKKHKANYATKKQNEAIAKRKADSKAKAEAMTPKTQKQVASAKDDQLTKNIKDYSKSKKSETTAKADKPKSSKSKDSKKA